MSSFLPVFIEYVKVDSGKSDYPDMGTWKFYKILYKFLCSNGSDFTGSIKFTQDFTMGELKFFIIFYTYAGSFQKRRRKTETNVNLYEAQVSNRFKRSEVSK